MIEWHIDVTDCDHLLWKYYSRSEGLNKWITTAILNWQVLQLPTVQPKPISLCSIWQSNKFKTYLIRMHREHCLSVHFLDLVCWNKVSHWTTFPFRLSLPQNFIQWTEESSNVPLFTLCPLSNLKHKTHVLVTVYTLLLDILANRQSVFTGKVCPVQGSQQPAPKKFPDFSMRLFPDFPWLYRPYSML